MLLDHETKIVKLGNDNKGRERCEKESNTQVNEWIKFYGEKRRREK